MSGSTRAAIRDALRLAIKGNTAAADAVYGPRDWPERPDRLPMIIVQSPPHERAQAIVKGQPSYETRAIFPVMVRVAAKTVGDVDTALEQLIGQTKAAVFSWLPFQQLVEQVASVETRTALTAEADYHLGEAAILFEAEFPEFYYPAPGVPLAEVQGTLTDQTTGTTVGSFDVIL